MTITTSVKVIAATVIRNYITTCCLKEQARLHENDTLSVLRRLQVPVTPSETLLRNMVVNGTVSVFAVVAFILPSYRGYL